MVFRKAYGLMVLGSILYVLCQVPWTTISTTSAVNNQYGDAQIEVEEFIQSAKDHNYDLDVSDIRIVFTRFMPNPLLGECFPDKGIVMVNESQWVLASPAKRQWIIYHELGHCVLHRPHNKQLDSEHMPVSIMYPDCTSAENEYYYYTHRDALVNELFP